jgi:hypothetical protein
MQVPCAWNNNYIYIRKKKPPKFPYKFIQTYLHFLIWIKIYMQIDVHKWKITDTTWIILVWIIQILSFKFFFYKVYS